MIFFGFFGFSFGGQIALVALSKTPTRLPEAAFVTFAPGVPGAETTPLFYVYYCVSTS